MDFISFPFSFFDVKLHFPSSLATVAFGKLTRLSAARAKAGIRQRLSAAFAAKVALALTAFAFLVAVFVFQLWIAKHSFPLLIMLINYAGGISGVIFVSTIAEPGILAQFALYPVKLIKQIAIFAPGIDNP